MSAKLTPDERNMTPSSVSAPDSSSSDVGFGRVVWGRARANSEKAWRECEPSELGTGGGG